MAVAIATESSTGARGHRGRLRCGAGRDQMAPPRYGWWRIYRAPLAVHTAHRAERSASRRRPPKAFALRSRALTGGWRPWGRWALGRRPLVPQQQGFQFHHAVRSKKKIHHVELGLFKAIRAMQPELIAYAHSCHRRL
jgi:hypothetical protein